MTGFYKPYQDEIYMINNLLPEWCHFDSYNYANRCFNFTFVDKPKMTFSEEFLKTSKMPDFFADNWDEVQLFIDTYFQEDDHLSALFGRLKSGFSSINDHSFADLHYHLLRIFNSYPVPPTKYIDGILRTVATECAKFRVNGNNVEFQGTEEGVLDSRLKYVRVDLMTNNKFEEFPWVKLRCFDKNNKAIRFKVMTDEQHEKWLDCILASQDVENTPFYGELLDIEALNDKREPSTLQMNKFFYSYLWYFWTFGNNMGDKYLEDDERRTLIGGISRAFVVPVYSAGLVTGGYGTIIGHLLIHDTSEGSVENAWKMWAPLAAQTLLKSREEALLSQPIKYGENILKDLLSKVVFIQDWEKISVYRKADDGKYFLRYCFKRFPGDDYQGHQSYEEIWDICKPEDQEEKNCYICDLNPANQIGGKLNGDKCYYWWPIKDILDPLVLPSIIHEEISRYKNHLICFEFPEYSFFPPKENIEESITEVGKHYTEKLIPLFDKLLLKKRVLQHSVKAAVSAIISRNHSHHIGSHVTPRSMIDKVQERLLTLGYKSQGLDKIAELQRRSANLQEKMKAEDIDRCDIEAALIDIKQAIAKVEDSFKDDTAVVNLLKSRLDSYIQKKADFSAEIGTEPLITTKVIWLFKEVFLPFLENTLLLDGIGANESVCYESMTNNRLKLRLLINGSEVDAKWFCSAKQPHEYAYSDYPYTGHFPACNDLSELKQIKGSFKDVQISVPGPLGEYAIYAILENFIRNSIKHNRSQLQEKRDGREGLQVFINIVDLEPDDPEQEFFYKVQIWDNLTNPCACRTDMFGQSEGAISLKNMLANLIERLIVDKEGRLKKGAWGIAEMKIMATLMRGSDDFLNMAANLDVGYLRQNGKDHLVYEFRVMKPKEIAVISNMSLAEDFQKGLQRSGIWHFDGLTTFSQHLDQAKSIASFRFVILLLRELHEEKLTKTILARLPCRVLRICSSEKLPGSSLLPKDCDLEKAIHAADSPADIINETWKHWVNFLIERHNLAGFQMLIYLHQETAISPSKEWEKLGRDCKKALGFQVNVAYIGYRHSGSNRRYPVLAYDRHAGIIDQIKNEDIRFYEAVDKGSSDFSNIFAEPLSCITAYEFAEAAMLNILILDERIAERAHDKMKCDDALKNYLENKLQQEPLRINLAKLANIFLCTDLAINGSDRPLHEHTAKKEPSLRICVKIDSEDRKLCLKSLDTFFGGIKKDCRYDIVIIHQGVLEGFFKDKIDPLTYEDFVIALKTRIPYVVITSGRGIPHEIPDSAKFLPFSLLEDYVMKGGVAKYRLTRILMDLIRRDV